MSHTTEADYQKQLEDLRELHRQAIEDTKEAHDHLALARNQKALDDDEIAALKLRTIPVTSFDTPAPQSNLFNNIQAAVYIDEQRLNDALHGFGREFGREIDERLTILTNEAIEREDRMIRHMTALITSSIKNNAAPQSTAPQSIPQNPSNVAPQPNAPQSINLAASTSPAPSSYLAASTSSLPHVPSTNYDYDKSVEVEQRKLINPDTTPVSIRLWLILFDIYSKHPNRLLSITEAFGEKALMNLKFMYPDEHVPTDETGFREFLNRHFLTTTNLFADIKAATAKVAMKSIVIAPLTLDSLHAYLAAFCAALIPFSEDLLTQVSDMDCQKTLIKSFSEGLPKSFRNIVEEVSCSTWSSLQKRFQLCLTPTNVQLAMARHHQWKQGWTGGTVPPGENPKETSTTNQYGLREGKRAASAKTVTTSTKPHRQSSKPDMIKSDPNKRSRACKNCRSDQHETLLCTVRTCFNCRDRGEHSTHLQSECKGSLQREAYINSVSASAAKAAAAKAVQEVYLFYNDEDEEEYSDYSTDAP